jgi:predicted nicotinamide N-methyase
MAEAIAQCDAAIDALSLLVGQRKSSGAAAAAVEHLAALAAAVTRSGHAGALARRRNAVNLVTGWLHSDDEAVLNAAAAAINALSTQDSHSPRTYAFHKSGVTLRLTDGSHCDGGLGWRPWRGALVLANLLPPVVSGRCVLELGAGLGLAGMVAAKLGAASVVLTDSVPALSAAQQENVAQNGLDAVVRVAQLDWDEAAPCTQCHEAECVIGSDVVYGNEHADALPRVLAVHLSKPGGFALLVNGVRFPDVLRRFLDNLETAGLAADVALLPSDAPIDVSVTMDGSMTTDLAELSVTLQQVPHLVTLVWHATSARPQLSLEVPQWMPAREWSWP